MHAPAAPTLPRVAVSYAWKEERTGINRGEVENFCQKLRDAGIEVVRDKDDAQLGDDLMQFMCEIGQSDSLCVFMSKAYLESFCCMYEFLVAKCRSLDNPLEFQQRVHIWLMEDAQAYRIPAARQPLTDLWNQRSTENKAYAERLLQSDALGDNTLKYIRRTQQIEQSIDELVQHACDHLSPRTADAFADIMISLHRVEEKQRADEVFENICADMNRALRNNSRVAKLFQEVAPNLFGNGCLEIAATATLRETSGPGTVLEPIYRKVKDNPVAADDDRQAVRDLCAGILLLSVDPKWVLHQRLAAQVEAVSIPGTAEVLRLPKPDQNTVLEVSLLRLCTAALADSAERFHEIFDNPSQDGRRMTPLPQRMPVIGTSEERVIQQQVIRAVFGDFVELASLTDSQKLASFQKRYNEALEAMEDEKSLYRKPWYTADPTWVEIAPRLKVGQLRLKDLLLYDKPAQQPAEVLPKMVRNLTLLWNIFTLLPVK